MGGLCFQVALDILTTLVRWSPIPLSEILVSQAFPAVVQCTLQSDDNSCLQVNFSNYLTILYYLTVLQQCQSSGLKSGGRGSVFKNWGVVSPRSAADGGT